MGRDVTGFNYVFSRNITGVSMFTMLQKTASAFICVIKHQQCTNSLLTVANKYMHVSIYCTKESKPLVVM